MVVTNSTTQAIRRLHSSSSTPSLSSMVVPSSTSSSSPRPLRRVRASSSEEEDDDSAINIYQQQQQQPPYHRPLSSLDSSYDDNDAEAGLYYNNEKPQPSADCMPLLSWLTLPLSSNGSAAAAVVSSQQQQQPMLSTQASMDEEKALDLSQQLRPLSEEAIIELGECEENPPQDPEEKDASKKRNSRLASSLKIKPLDVDQYVARRKMTKQQEKWNALTMIPASVYCVYFLLSQAWIQTSMVVEAQREYQDHYVRPRLFSRISNVYNANANFETVEIDGMTGALNHWLGDEHTGCLGHIDEPQSTVWFFPAIPPMTVLALILGTVAHMPFSFIYHWTYAHRLHGKARINHWSRRMDQAMIHFAAACFSYGTSGNLTYFLVAALFNLHSALRLLFSKYHRPRTNQLRVGIAMIAYLWPVLRRGDLGRFSCLVFLCGIGCWFFAKYPIGGWSHAAFHLAISPLTPILLSVAMELPASQPQLKLAAQCSVLLNQSHGVAAA